MKKIIPALFASLFVLTACPSSEEKGATTEKAGDTAKPAAAEKAAAAGLKLDGLELTIDLPADSSQMNMLGNIMITGGGTVVSVAEVKAEGMDPKTFEEAKEAKGDYSPTSVTKEEKTADGWLITFVNKGGAGENYFVWSRRTINGKSYKCETTANSQEQADKAVAACASLK